MFRVELKAMLCSLIKYQPSENNTGVELAAHDMKVRPVPERLVSSMPMPLNLKKPQSINEASQKQKTFVRGTVQ